MAANSIKLGVIGLSKGNGHPYSWSAICNGYNAGEMAKCPFPVIPEYLSQQVWPEARIPNVEVTHVWTQELRLSKSIAAAANIRNIVQRPTEMIGEVDGVLLARDDAENHAAMALPFIEAGLPVYIDKPMALTVADARKIFDARKYEGQIFSCSALRYASELLPTTSDLEKTGPLLFAEAHTPKSWDKYAVHLLDPILVGAPTRGGFIDIDASRHNGITRAVVKWENFSAHLSVYGSFNLPIQIKWFGEKDFVTKTFTNTFEAFKQAIEDFLKGFQTRKDQVSKEEIYEIVTIIEKGKNG